MPPAAPSQVAEVPVSAQTVRFDTLPFALAELRPELDAAIAAVLDRGQLARGPELPAFEAEFAAECNAHYCVGVGSGMDALELILRAYGIGPGDEVLVPAHAFVATWLAVSHVGATPVPVEVDPRTYCLAAPSVRYTGLVDALTPRTKALVAADLYGRKVPTRHLAPFCKLHGIALIIDASQAHGARAVDGTERGLIGDAAAFSFHPTANLGCLGDGGAVVSDDASLIERVRHLRGYGATVDAGSDVHGLHSRLDEIQAAVLRVRLRHLDDWNRRRQDLASKYLAILQGQVEVLSPPGDAASCDVWHNFVVRTSRRDALAEHLRKAGIETAVDPKVPCHQSAAYAREFAGRSFPVAEALAAQCLSLPLSPHHTADQIGYVAAAVRTFIAAR